MAKKARVWTGTEFVELASAQTDLTAYSTTAQMNTAITAASGLTLIKTQTIGTAVTSVTVTNAFSATCDNYLITINGGVGSVNNNLKLTLGSTVTGYFSASVLYVYNSAATFVNNNNHNAACATSFPFAGAFSTDTISMQVNLQNPFLTKRTIYRSTGVETLSAGAVYFDGGILNDTTSYTGFTVTTASGNLTGGTIRVYGYKNS